MNRFGSAVILLIVTELILAYWATWVHATLGSFAALTFTMAAIAAWLNLVPEIVREFEE